MSRRGGLYRLSDDVHPSELFENSNLHIGLVGYESMDWEYDYPVHHPDRLPPGRYRYQSTELRDGQHREVTTTIAIQETPFSGRPHRISNNGSSRVPRRRSDRTGASSRQRANSNPTPNASTGRTPDLVNVPPTAALTPFPSLQTRTQVRIPAWMSPDEAADILEEAFADQGIPQAGEIEIICPSPDDVEFFVRSRPPQNGANARDMSPFDETQPMPASAAAIRGLGTKTIAAQEDGESCGICMEEKCEGEKVTILQCGHWFDTECVSQWLSQCNRTCPTCRASVEDVNQPGAETHHRRVGASGPVRNRSFTSDPRSPRNHMRGGAINNHFRAPSSDIRARPPTRNPHLAAYLHGRGRGRSHRS